MTTPDLYTYLDYRRFMGDWYAWKKKANPRFSFRAFTRRASLKSPSLLHHVIDGKRNLTANTLDGVCRAMGLNATQKAFFRKLVELDAASTMAERNRIYSEVSASRNFRQARQVEGAGFEYLSRWYYPAIRELAHCADFQSDPAWIAARLRPAITPANARKALAALETMGLLEPDGQGGLQPTEASVVTPHEVTGLAVHNYHFGMIDRARDAIEGFDPEHRHFGAVTLAVPMELVGQLKDEVAAFQERLLALCDHAEGDREAVYQLNLNLFPLTDVDRQDEAS